MLRKDHDRQTHNFSDRHDDLPSTQDYIRRAMDDTVKFDDDFSQQPWLSALQFLGAEDGLIPSTPISSIKKCFNGDKVVQVVAVVKSCTPNGLGGLLVSLKDPTGTIDASIHHKVLSGSDFGKELTTGAVLILKEVAIFTPVRSAHYLNVTMRNLVKVFCQNKGSTPELYKSVHPVKYADPESCQKAKAMEDRQTEMLEDTETRHCTRTEIPRIVNITQRLNLFAGSSQSNNRDSSHVTPAKRAYVNISQHACNKEPEEMIKNGITGDEQEIVNGTQRGTKGGNAVGGLLGDSDNMTNPLAETTGEKARGTNEVQTQKQPLMSTNTLPQWTDEQLDELFDDDGDMMAL